MPGFLTDYNAPLVLDTITKRGTATSYLEILTAAPTHTSTLSTVTELSISGYSRQAVTWSVPAFNSSAGAWSTSNTAAVVFGPFATDMTSIAIYLILVSAASGTSGNIQYAFQLDLNFEALAGTPVQVDIGALAIYAS